MGVTVGRASSYEIGQAAYTMLQTCVVERGMGGMAYDIGGDNNINVAITDYKPNVKCDSTSTPGPNWNSCVSVFVNMKATKQVRVFGSYGDPDVEEQLPLVLEAAYATRQLILAVFFLIADGGCQLRIEIEGPPSIATWYELWEATTAITTMCTRFKEKGGKAKGLGLRGNIRLELSEKKLEPGVKAGNASTVSLADTGITLQYFDTVTAQAGATGYDPGFPFELVAGGSRDNGSLVTLSGDSGTNGSVMASA
ncbi:hypothetical protein IMSHALPRED_006196 [Imshaugia aleurites]|uniref:Uncharacterized protein n=1 Tax=Imshaugia aleurites TaxID=172621 RepID=A0A8H3IR86_9LECA|nr:hypothetical protein IMSHALPRED_006196 [Imshaugia aleurites]